MPLLLEHSDLPEPLVFSSVEDALGWARREASFWASIKTSGSSSAEAYARRAQTLMQRVVDAANKPDAEQAITQVFNAITLELKYLSGGAHGQLLAAMKSLGHDDKSIAIALTVMVKPEEARSLITHNNYWLYDGIVGLSYMATLDAGGDPAALREFLSTIERSTAEFRQEVDVAKAENATAKGEYNKVLTHLREGVGRAESTANAAAAHFQTSLDEIKAKFEQQFALRTPMTYWREKADRHFAAARTYRRWFGTLQAAGFVIFGAITYISLLPFLQTHPNAYWALIVFSVGVAIWAWPLRIASKLYLTHTQLFEDAAEREVIARTFLALGDLVQLTDSDRQLLLGALLRPASISLASDDSGLNIADVILAKTLTKN